ncbi:Lipopolysaccharide-modifying protein [Purpureocillium lavendulum]|uniref:Lipopolysaccharide-modifying protein n=1 Tax=Purpureocillium lavendulum TaxID=1247861 RepID=A0AB34FDT6_9HYPO|nr:Lipopolysaccharide-modifying protein [Purpureocillium lavendulum]
MALVVGVRRRQRFYLVAVALVFTVGLVVVAHFLPDVGLPTSWIRGRPKPWTAKNTYAHVLDHLIRDSNSRFQKLLGARSITVEEATAKYRERRGRHPPPGFDVWFAQAQKDSAIVVEEFFDRIHHDLNPFWALNPKDLRELVSSQPQLIRVRAGKVGFETDDPNRQPWIQLWTALIKETEPHLPDLDMVVNIMDENRLLVPWDEINRYASEERAKRKFVDPKAAKTAYGELADAPRQNPYDPGWITSDANKYWDYLRAACPPDSLARNVTGLTSFDGAIKYPHGPMPYMRGGFVENVTMARDPCLQPHLRGMHGAFIESVSMSTTQQLFPMFAGSKLPQNNEVVIPGAMYLSGREFYNGGEWQGPEWPRKKDGLMWRGTASGGRNKADNWWHFHRHRWVQMLNGTTVGAVESGNAARGPSLDIPVYWMPAHLKGRLGKWLSTFADVAFVNLECFPREQEEVGFWPFKRIETKRTCAYTSPYMAVMPSVPMKKQYEYKYLPDVDGNSFSGRWRAFLRSTSLPLKATIYTEWHDDRFVPWVHYVPFDNSYRDIYAVMDYFLAHDEAAETIATEGKRWAEQVYRREDMKLYVWRLLLEYARVMDDDRDLLAYVADLI